MDNAGNEVYLLSGIIRWPEGWHRRPMFDYFSYLKLLFITSIPHLQSQMYPVNTLQASNLKQNDLGEVVSLS